MKSTKEPLTFDLATVDSLPIKITGKQKKRHGKALSEAQLFAKFGVHVLRVKTKVLAELGKGAAEAGIKHIGHGKIILASDHADNAIGKLSGIVDDLMTSSDGPNYELILDVMRLQRDFNQQMVNTATVHFTADKQAAQDHKGTTLSLSAFPSGGGQIMVAVAPSKEVAETEPKT